MSSFDEFLAAWKQRIVSAVRRHLEPQARALGAGSAWGPDFARRFAEFSAGGKMMRGALVALGYLLFRESPPAAVDSAAAAMELLQSALLVHDDIMDRDATRRGSPTLFRQYEQIGELEGIAESRHFGEAMGICAGDAGFFLALELLAGLPLDPGLVLRILRTVHAAVLETCMAQMQDVYLGLCGEAHSPSEVEVLGVYRSKTARYSFALPLQIGAMIAGCRDGDLAALEALAGTLGLLFQIKDDELGLYGSESEIGKPVGSDVASGKKTLFYVYLMEAVPPDERRRVQALFGRPPLHADDLERVRRLVEEHGVRARVQARAVSLAREAHAAAALAGTREDARRLLHELIDLNLSRTR